MKHSAELYSNKDLFQVMMVMGKSNIQLEKQADGNWVKDNVQIEECNEVIYTGMDKRMEECVTVEAVKRGCDSSSKHGKGRGVL